MAGGSLYRLTFSDKIATMMSDENKVTVKMALRRRLKPDEARRNAEQFDADSEAFEVDFMENPPELTTKSDDDVHIKITEEDISLTLNTTNIQGAGSSGEYWLDSGKVL